MEYKDYSSMANKSKTKRISKKLFRAFWILLVVIIGLILLAFMIYGLVIGIYRIFDQDTLRLFT
ncbi:hypothetical protein [Metamycoplasma alkalescens]|uniref:Uncharacterized protein n=2 Tax=Metamycoplasma alkalescens TaxID=45363 RepID=N9TZB3_9BACT|nr:hypothetical protein [Metamycoplasma alkalescens]ENY53647.1 Hypothetical protein MALK_5890 [Metamycoplasma alkalescens 14918]PYF43126.1 hypothetical protein BCF88_10550 [Metamycoplasma alkalescens]